MTMLKRFRESNNQYIETVIVSVPGVRVTSENPTMLIEGTTDSSTTWSLDLTNTALFETNASIVVSESVRMQDGVRI